MNSSLLRFVLFKRIHMRFIILFLSLSSCLLGLMSPFFQKLFIDQILNQQSLDSPEAQSVLKLTNSISNMIPQSLSLITASFLLMLVSQSIGLFTNFIATRESIIIQKILGEYIYKKMLSFKKDSMSRKSVGEIVALYATDIAGATTLLESSLPMGAAIFFPILLAPLFIYKIFQIPQTPILVSMSIIVFFHFILSMRQARFFFKFKQLAAERSGLVNEWIQNIRTLRILNWVELFEAKIFKKRIEETQNRVEMVTNGQLNSSVASSANFFINLSGLLSLIYLSHQSFSPGTLLSLLWIFGVFLTRPFRSLPWVLTFALDGYSSIKRLEKFIQTENTSESMDWSKAPTPPIDVPEIKIQGLNLHIRGHHILKNINLEIKPKEFVAIIGEVGSGKTMLLNSLLRDVHADFKNYQIANEDQTTITEMNTRKYYSYVPQDPFIMSAWIRDNIAFEYDTDKSKDAKILDSLVLAEFNPENERMHQGLLTEIGERGVNLSGGQKQRLSLARGIYFDRPILLLDDSLSAVDSNTEHKLLENLFLKSAQNKTRILVTHRLSILKDVDRIIFMNSGEIQDQGTFEELSKRNPSFNEFILKSERQGPNVAN